MKIKENRKTINKPRRLPSVGEHSSCSANSQAPKFSHISSKTSDFSKPKLEVSQVKLKKTRDYHEAQISVWIVGNTIIVKYFIIFLAKFNRAGMVNFRRADCRERVN